MTTPEDKQRMVREQRRDATLANLRAQVEFLARLEASQARAVESRDTLALEAADYGATYEQIADAAGLSKPRVSQVLKEQREKRSGHTTAEAPAPTTEDDHDADDDAAGHQPAVQRDPDAGDADVPGDPAPAAPAAPAA